MRTGHGGIRYITNYEEVVPIGLVSPTLEIFCTVIIITAAGRCTMLDDNFNVSRRFIILNSI